MSYTVALWHRRLVSGLFNMEARVRSQVSPGEIYSGQCENRTGFPPNIFVVPVTVIPPMVLSHLIRISFIFNSPFYKFFVLLAVYFYCTWGIDKYSGKIIHIKVKQPHYRPGQTLGVPEG
jgi:hypothetical protein